MSRPTYKNIKDFFNKEGAIPLGILTILVIIAGAIK